MERAKTRFFLMLLSFKDRVEICCAREKIAAGNRPAKKTCYTRRTCGLPASKPLPLHAVSESAELLNFEQSLARLEEIARGLEDNKLGLNDSLLIYEEGIKLLRQCQGLLQQAERKIELLTGVDATGQAITKPFDADATFSATEAVTSEQRLTRRRKSPAAKEPAATKETIVATTETVTVTTETTEAAPWEDLPVTQDSQGKTGDSGRKTSTKSNSQAIDDLNRLF